jgi:hypothetical protein
MHQTVAGAARAPRTGGKHRSVSLIVVFALFIAATSSPAVASAAVWKPTVAQVFAEQAASQRMITALVDNEVSKLAFGKPTRKGSSQVHVSVTAYLRSGGSLSGKLVLKRYKTKWYVYTITAGGTARGVSAVTIPAGISSAALGSCVTRQSKNQRFATGVRYRHFRTASVTSVSRNWGTATVKLRLSGGSRSARNAYLTCYSQTSTAGKTYWFMTALK